MYARSFELDTDDPQFQIGATDSGLCYVLNGDNIRSTYAKTQRVDEISQALDQRYSTEPAMIKGSGEIYEKTFYIDIGDR